MTRFHALAAPIVAFATIAGVFGAETRAHWSFQALEKPVPPAVTAKDWVRNPIDQFALARLTGAKLQPNPEADRLTLIRRLTLDLTGLPPTLAEIDSFLADTDPGAYERLVDRLLASPHYGERWGRHWLDVARYVQGKTKVAAVDRVDMADPYRDYVVRALNADKPYDRFVIEQLAGDLLPLPDDEATYFDQRAAPGFLSIGPWFADCADPNTLRMDIIDEQMSTATQAFLGVNFNCARCHDHFFDPIPTRDYYALAGIFGSTRILKENSESWRDGRFRLTQPEATRAQIKSDESIRGTIAELRAERWEALKEERTKLLAQIEPRIAEYDEALAGLPPMVAVEIEAEDYNGQNNVRRVPFGEDGGMVVETQRERLQWVGWRVDLPEAGTYTVYLRGAAPESYKVEIKIDGKSVAQEVALPATGGGDPENMRWVDLGHYLFRQGTVDFRVWAQDHSYLPRIDRLRFVRTPPLRGKWLLDAAKEHRINQSILSELQPLRKAWPPTVADAERFIESRELDDIDRESAKLQELYPTLPHMLAVEDAANIVDEPIHVGGDVYNTDGDPVPRAVPTLLDGIVDRPAMPADESGRLQFAQWIVDGRNPLAPRVIANRLWQGHFGTGLVATPGDLGIQGQEPTHPELLDWLAATLVENDWSLKSLHRLIVTSATYRMSSASNPGNAKIDPDNKLYWRFPRRRLEAEALYDGMLASIGKVPRQPAGHPLDTRKAKDRAMYILTSGRSPLGMGIEIRKMLALFGYDDSGVPVHQRDRSATTAQSLFWLNNKLPRYYATKLAEQLLNEAGLDDRHRIIHAFCTITTRPPSRELLEHSVAYLETCRSAQGLSDTDALARVILGLFSSDAYLYLQ